MPEIVWGCIHAEENQNNEYHLDKTTSVGMYFKCLICGKHSIFYFYKTSCDVAGLVDERQRGN